MKKYGFDISSLFSNLNSNNTMGSFNLSDYASIKNGSYGKLVKSYYSEQKKSNVTDKTSDKNNVDKVLNNRNKKDTADKTGLTQVKSSSDSLKTSLETLAGADMWKTKDGEYDKNKIASAVKDFVNGYNNTLDQTAKVTSKDISRDTNYMTSMTDTMSKALKQVGITVADNGKLSVNEEELNNASGKELKALFSGAGSYGGQIMDRASDISKDALMNSSMYGNNGALSSSMSGMFNQWI